MWRLIGSPGYPEDRESVRERAGETFDRGVSASGVLRQMLAIVTQPNRSRQLHGLRVPALVIHGDSDRMVHVSGGRATAQAIPGAELIADQGHGPRHAAGALRDHHRRHPPHSGPGPNP